ncbi:MAG TPA: hypothetical protein VNE61_15495 [Ktedonobacteraceae bacterium]|nr:hypothetical protein [Ktedonobacteraceae bacterium]
MPRDPRKHQKAIMKKRSKEKAAAQHRAHQQTFMPLSPQTIIERARTYPMLECWISADWQGDMGLVQIVVARQQPDGDICFATYLVDKLCLGVKDTFANAGFSRSRYEREVLKKASRLTKLVQCPAELAHQMVYGSIDFAARFGFKPQQDFALSQYLLTPRGELDEPYQLTFGRNGKPFFVSGPYDNTDRILRQLEKTAGPGNFDYLMMIGEG